MRDIHGSEDVRTITFSGRSGPAGRRGDRDGVLGMGAAGAVAAAQRPAVGVGVDLVGVCQEPRLDRDHQAGLEREPAAAPAVVGHVRVAVHGPADAVAAELGVDLVARLRADPGDGGRDVADLVARAGRLDAGGERRLGGVDQLLVSVRGVPTTTLSAESETQPSTDGGEVEAEQVAVAQP